MIPESKTRDLLRARRERRVGRAGVALGWIKIFSHGLNPEAVCLLALGPLRTFRSSPAASLPPCRSPRPGMRHCPRKGGVVKHKSKTTQLYCFTRGEGTLPSAPGSAHSSCPGGRSGRASCRPAGPCWVRGGPPPPTRDPSQRSRAHV